MLGLSPSHILIVAVIALLFGSKRIPELGAGLGQGIRAFKAAIDGQTTNLSNAQLPKPPLEIAKDRAADAEVGDNSLV